jgi:CheY-like chemotaxis protein
MDASAALHTPHVLVVDDETQVRTLFGRFLQHSGMKVAFAPDGLLGLSLARTQVPDVIVTDLHMPRMDGVAFCRALRGDPLTRAIPIVAVSGDGDERLRAALDAGCDAIIPKPCSGRVLIACVEHLLGRTARFTDGGGLPGRSIER